LGSETEPRSDTDDFSSALLNELFESDFESSADFRDASLSGVLFPALDAVSEGAGDGEGDGVAEPLGSWSVEGTRFGGSELLGERFRPGIGLKRRTAIVSTS
jgi:hypothetical protein